MSNGEMPDVIYGVTWNGTEKVNYTYDSLGRLTNKNVNSVLNNNYSYIDVNSTKTTTLLSSLSTVAGTYSYTYDELGNITSINDGTYTTSYEYDDLNQLVRVNDQKAGVTYTYEYSNGNITSKKEYAYTTGDLGSLQDTITWNYADSTWGDLLTSFDGKSITYDAIGNPVTYGNYTINWNGRRLESINLNDTEVLSYSYNIDGQRVSKTYEGVTTQYFYNGDILAGEKTGNNVIIYMYDNNGDIFGFTYNGTEYYYIKNAQNDVVAIADASGNVVVRYYYNAWGEIIDCVDNTTFELSSINPITYRSYYNDNIVGMDMYYLNSRYYMADWGRFVSADSVVSEVGGDVLGYNMFAYCQNNPVNMSDEDGNWPKWATKVVAAVAVVAVVATVAAITVATAGAGTAVAVIAIGAAKGAAIGMASGAAIGAATGAVKHRVSTGSWNGAGTAALNGMGDGALSGAVTGAITGTVGSALKVGQAAKAWDSSSKGGPWTNMSDHYKRHVLQEGKKAMTKNVITYTNDAKALWNSSNGVGKLMSSGSLRLKGLGVGGFYSESGLIRSFFYQ